MTQLTLDDAAHRLVEIVHGSPVGEEIMLTEHNVPVAKLVTLPTLRRHPRRGSGKEFIGYIADDFDVTPEGFEEYMP